MSDTQDECSDRQTVRHTETGAISEDSGIESVASHKFTGHYVALRKMAHARLRTHKPFTLLGTTELVHESYLKFVSDGATYPADHAAFLGYAGNVMRSVIVDAARKRLAQRRGMYPTHLELDEFADCITDDPATEIMQVHDALQDLNKVEPRLAKIMELRYFAGMTEVEIGQCLSLSDRTVRREVDKAHLMLRAMLN